jgi:acyl-coenzyme A thioesterase PaaI-like protein
VTEPRPIPGISADPAADLAALRNVFEAYSAADRTQRWLDGRLPRIPAMALFGVHPQRADPDESLVELELRPDMLDADGHAPSGLLAFLTDVVTGTAVSASLPVAKPMVTVTITVEPAVDELPSDGFLVAHARVVSTRGDLIFAQGEIREAKRAGEQGDRVLARVGAWYLRLASRPGGTNPEAHTTPQPPAPDLGLGPVGQLIGVRSVELGPLSARAVLPMKPELMNIALNLHGGVGALYADLVCGAALGAGGSYRPLTSTYSYLRAAGSQGADVEVRARVLKPGRVVATVEAEVLSSEGKPALHVVTNAARVTPDAR